MSFFNVVFSSSFRVFLSVLMVFLSSCVVFRDFEVFIMLIFFCVGGFGMFIFVSILGFF